METPWLHGLQGWLTGAPVAPTDPATNISVTGLFMMCMKGIAESHWGGQCPPNAERMSPQINGSGDAGMAVAAVSRVSVRETYQCQCTPWRVHNEDRDSRGPTQLHREASGAKTGIEVGYAVDRFWRRFAFA